MIFFDKMYDLKNIAVGNNFGCVSIFKIFNFKFMISIMKKVNKSLLIVKLIYK